uniref:Uncharacterized protein n=1 Tax=viral metagenome TaxID=1070528 RepID=A0A6C0EAS9_9ZZZZ
MDPKVPDFFESYTLDENKLESIRNTIREEIYMDKQKKIKNNSTVIYTGLSLICISVALLCVRKLNFF